MTSTILTGDALEMLKTIESGTVNTCVTSPPYYNLRNYGVDGQIGLEETPEQYINKLVAVFREVRRVLRDDGTLWVNIGDSYCNTNGYARAQPEFQRQGRNDAPANDRDLTQLHKAGFKTKDLIGIPWLLAFALRQPYYSGRIKNELDRIWLAAIIDGEGCIFIHKRKAGQNNGQGYVRQNDSYSACLEVANTHESIVNHCMEITGQGSITFQDKESAYKNRNQRLFRWHLQSTQAKELLREIYPYLVAKKKEARLALGCPSSGDESDKAHRGLMLLHNGSETTIDYPEPLTMFEKGYYLRQDVIWSKPNPMPESVTDRCTKSHEYIFLLSKSKQYYYDAEAIQETAQTDSCFHGGGEVDKSRNDSGRQNVQSKYEGKKNKRSVWTVTVNGFKEAHFATFPQALIEPCILAGAPMGGLVLDPFTGSGTTAIVALQNGRNFIGTELNPKYVTMAEKRIKKQGHYQERIEVMVE